MTIIYSGSLLGFFLRGCILKLAYKERLAAGQMWINALSRGSFDVVLTLDASVNV